MVQTLDVVVGRRSIFDDRDVIGYEMLFRRPAGDIINGQQTGGQMTAAVIYSALNIGLDSIAGSKMLFCNADRGTLTGDAPILLPPERIVLEVLSTVAADDEVERGVAALAQAGYRIALDNFTIGASRERLLNYASIVKVDLATNSPETVRDIVSACARSGVALLADSVDDRSLIPELQQLGFTMFQGYALEQPVAMSGQVIAPADIARLQAAVDVLSRDDDLDAYEELLRRDAGLADQVIRLASSGRYGETRRTISSIRSALVTAGTRAVRRWLILLLARPESTTNDDHALMTVLLRARACEMLAGALPDTNGVTAFTAGLLSSLDEVLGAPPHEIAKHLRLSPELEEAAFGSLGPLADLVRDVADYRFGAPAAQGAETAAHTGLPMGDFDDAFAGAFGWVVNTLAAIG